MYICFYTFILPNDVFCLISAIPLNIYSRLMEPLMTIVVILNASNVFPDCVSYMTLILVRLYEILIPCSQHFFLFLSCRYPCLI
jgi:hypothetical protein